MVDVEPDCPLAAAFKAWIRSDDYPCLGAKSALARGQMNVAVANDIHSSADDTNILAALSGTAESYREDTALFRSHVVVFEAATNLTEIEFETALWRRLQSLTDRDVRRGNTHDTRVSCDARDPHFSLSFGGEAFYVIGLHPNASRPARRFERAAIVFNLHDQFQQLRALNIFDGLSSKIGERDAALAGCPNPMLGRHGETSEARQYSGRVVGSDWRCPFQRHATEKAK